MTRRHLPSVAALNQKDAARLSGINLDTFKKIPSRDPANAPHRNEDGTYDLDAIGRWIRKQERCPEDGRLDPVQERARKDKALADKIEMENAARRGELVETGAVVAAGTEMVIRSRARLLRIPDAATPLLIGQTDHAAIHNVLTDMIHDALSELSETWARNEGGSKDGYRTPGNL